MSYRRVTYEVRLSIKAYLDAGLNQVKIASKLGFDKSTVCREIRRNTGGGGYRPKQAQRLTESRQLYRQTPRRLVPQMIKRIEQKLRLKWSPEQISHRFRKEGLPSVAAETIDRHVSSDRVKGGELWRHLRWSRRQRKRRFPSEERRGKIQNATPLSERPKQANQRKRRGHWERDTMIGKNRKTAILALVDRKTRFNKFAKLNRRLAPGVTSKTIALLSGLACRSITNDRGQEFSDHQRLSRKLKVQVYFCDPYSSYQRGTNENRIGILRQYFPKKTDFSHLLLEDLEKGGD